MKVWLQVWVWARSATVVEIWSSQMVYGWVGAEEEEPCLVSESRWELQSEQLGYTVEVYIEVSI